MAGEMDRNGDSAPTTKELQSAETVQGIQVPLAWVVLLIASNWYYILWGRLQLPQRTLWRAETKPFRISAAQESERLVPKARRNRTD